jgi:transposase
VNRYSLFAVCCLTWPYGTAELGYGDWATRRRRAEKADGALSRTPSARTIARLMTVCRDVLSKAETLAVAAIEGGVPLLVEARDIIAAFQMMIRKKLVNELGHWIERSRSSLVASFANGIVKDLAAVTAAITSPWCNGQTEGQITKLKLVKRQMYGRGKKDRLASGSRYPRGVAGASKLCQTQYWAPITPQRGSMFHA